MLPSPALAEDRIRRSARLPSGTPTAAHFGDGLGGCKKRRISQQARAGGSGMETLTRYLGVELARSACEQT